MALGSNQIFGGLDAGEASLTALEAVLFAVLSPLAVGVVAAVYLLSIRTFIGRVGTFREVYRMAAYAYGAMILAWIPLVCAFAVTYALMVLMGLAVRYVYRTSLLTAVVTALVGFVPVEVALIWLPLTTAGLAARSTPRTPPGPAPPSAAAQPPPPCAGPGPSASEVARARSPGKPRASPAPRERSSPSERRRRPGPPSIPEPAAPTHVPASQ